MDIHTVFSKVNKLNKYAPVPFIWAGIVIVVVLGILVFYNWMFKVVSPIDSTVEHPVKVLIREATKYNEDQKREDGSIKGLIKVNYAIAFLKAVHLLCDDDAAIKITGTDVRALRLQLDDDQSDIIDLLQLQLKS